MNIALIHAVNTGKMTLAEAQKKDKGATAPKTSEAATKGDKSETAAPAGK